MEEINLLPKITASLLIQNEIAYCMVKFCVYMSVFFPFSLIIFYGFVIHSNHFDWNFTTEMAHLEYIGGRLTSETFVLLKIKDG